jgi:hypothetical protein
MSLLFGILPVAALLALTYGMFRILRFFRDRDMRSLAVKWGFEYKSRALPESFRLDCYPANCIKTVWNVIEGQQGGTNFLIFDSTVGEVKGVYCTFVATQAQKSVFTADVAGEKVVEASGWSAVYRIRFIQIPPWTLSVLRVEDRLKEVLSGTSAIQK